MKILSIRPQVSPPKPSSLAKLITFVNIFCFNYIFNSFNVCVFCKIFFRNKLDLFWTTTLYSCAKALYYSTICMNILMIIPALLQSISLSLFKSFMIILMTTLSLLYNSYDHSIILMIVISFKWLFHNSYFLSTIFMVILFFML